MLGSRVVHSTQGCWAIPAGAWYVVVVLVIVAYGYLIRQAGAADLFEEKVIDDPAVDNFDGWAALHLLFWGLLGFYYPGRYLQAMGLSLAWEGFEDLLGRGQLRLAGRRLQLVGDGSETGFWYGRYVTDSAFNLFGYILGSALAARLWPADAGCPAGRCP